MDATIRQLQRNNPNAAILAKLRAGQYQEWQIEALAALGNPLFGGSQVPEWTNWEVRHDLLQKLPLRLRQEFAIICAEKALPAWEADYQQDERPRKAIEAAKALLRGEIGAEECRKAASAAAAAWAASAAYAAAWAAHAADASGWDWQVPSLTSLILAWED